MNVDKLTLIYFSPTGTTRRVLKAVADGMGAGISRFVDLTPPAFLDSEIPAIEAGSALIGVPVYAGRVPLTAVERLKKLRARGVPAAIVVLYGNRAFEDALLELKEITLAGGFVPVAAGAFIGEHSYARKDSPIALGRPDENDLIRAREFGAMLKGKLGAAPASADMKPVEVPGKVPHRERMPHGGLAPRTREEICTLCATCQSVCPTGAVIVDDAVVTDPARCILCQACVKRCPTGARVMEAEAIEATVKKLMTHCTARLEPEWFL